MLDEFVGFSRSYPDECCWTCRFWKHRFLSDEADYRDTWDGYCRRYAPRPSTPVELDDASEKAFAAATRVNGKLKVPATAWSFSMIVWPLTEDKQWCGEWRAKSAV